MYPAAWLLTAALLLTGYFWDSIYGGQGDGSLRSTLAIVRPADLVLASMAGAVALALLSGRVAGRLVSPRAVAASRPRQIERILEARACQIGLALSVGTLTLGALNALVLSPMAIGPGRSPLAIYSAVVRMFGPGSLAIDLVPLAIWIVFWGGLQVVVTRLLWRGSVRWNYVLSASLALSGLAIAFEFVAGVYLAMDVADATLPGYGTVPALTFYLWIAGRIMLSAALILLTRPPGAQRQQG